MKNAIGKELSSLQIQQRELLNPPKKSFERNIDWILEQQKDEKLGFEELGRNYSRIDKIKRKLNLYEHRLKKLEERKNNNKQKSRWKQVTQGKKCFYR